MSKHKKRRLRPPSLHRPGGARPATRKAPRPPRRWNQPAAIVATLLLVIAMRVVHGAITDRSGNSASIAAVGKRLHAVPTEFGEWQGRAKQVEAIVLREAEIVDYVYRIYEHASTNHEIAMLAVVGRPGPIAIHTPDDCFVGAGYKQLKDNTKKLFDLAASRPAEFFTADFEGEQEVGKVRVYWSWNAGDGWVAPDVPRIQFAGVGALCKLYVLTPLAGPAKQIDESTTDFVEHLAPLIDQALLGKANR